MKKVFSILILFLLLFSCKKENLNFPVKLNLNELVHSGISGVWGDALSHSEQSKYSGEPIIFEQNGTIKAFSTTGHSIWFGSLSNKILRAEYFMNRSYQGNITLNLSENGKVLKGNWQAGSLTGTYVAYKINNVDINTVKETLLLYFKKDITLK